MREKYQAQGLVPRGSTPEEPAAATRAQLASYGELIKSNDIRAG